MLGHQAQIKTQQQKNRSFGLFHSEYTVNGDFYHDGFDISVYGRIDGIYEIRNRIEVEEIKSVILTAADFKKIQIESYPEFSEQVLFYSYLLQKERSGIEILPFITLINLVNDKSKSFPVSFSPPFVENLIFKRIGQITENIRQEQLLTEKRKKQLDSINFQLTEKRIQQQKMIQAVEECLNNQKHLLVSAPTGTGKTAASLFPAIRYAVLNNKKIFFATSKTTQQKIVDETIVPICSSDLEFTAVFLRSAQKMCANEIFFCHEDFCPFAKEYPERLTESNILSELLEKKLLHPHFVFEQARNKFLCPAEVLLDLTVYADLVVGDYNYVFDPSAFLRRLFLHKDYSDWILIIDEAHNLYQRGIDYFSPLLRRRLFSDLIKIYKSKKIKIYQNLLIGLKDIFSLLESIHKEGEIHFESRQFFEVQLDTFAWNKAFANYETAFIKYLIYKVKKKMILQDDPFEQIYFIMRRFVQVAQLQGASFIPFYNAEDGGILKIQCCDPSEHLGNRISGFHSVIGMSATLDPINYYQNVLGFPHEQTNLMQLDSPFPTQNRKLIVIPDISTKFSKRSLQYPNYAHIIENIIKLKPGNYIAFFPSFEFLQNTNLFLGRIKSEKILQRTGMSEVERDHVLQKLKQQTEPKLLLAVMGGIFSEGVDYSGDMCIGVIIFSPALPKINYERELIRQYYENKNNNGFDYAYLYPGMNKVIQAVGRLIRSKQDKGIIVLVGERFAEEKVNELFPDYWFEQKGDVIITDDYEKEIKDFWKRFD